MVKMIIYYLKRVFKKIGGYELKNSIIHKTSKVEAGSQIVNSKFDKYTFCGYNCEIINTEIGPFCSISNDVKIGNYNHPMNWGSTSPAFIEGRDSISKKFSKHTNIDQKLTKIEADVWIGTNVIVKQGVVIGTGAIIGAGSVVTKNVEPYSIVAGNPASLIRYRFNSEYVEVLLKSKWWTFNEDKLSIFAKKINNIDDFVNELKNI
jgi:acetyltransferase-like isoleucine patch superfamily enzyme